MQWIEIPPSTRLTDVLRCANNTTCICRVSSKRLLYALSDSVCWGNDGCDCLCVVKSNCCAWSAILLVVAICSSLTSNCCLSSSIKADCSLVWACKKLLTVKPYQEIFVIDISNQAHISRRTFYRNFKSKDDVINQYVISLLKKYTDWILQVNPPNL